MRYSLSLYPILLCFTWCLVPCIARSQFIDWRNQKAGPVAKFGNQYIYVEEQPMFRGDVLNYMNTHLKYPKMAIDSGWQGKVVVKFVVNARGKVVRPEVTQSSGYAVLDAEAVRLVLSMPRWKPGKSRGTPVDVYFTAPIHFTLDP